MSKSLNAALIAAAILCLSVSAAAQRKDAMRHTPARAEVVVCPQPITVNLVPRPVSGWTTNERARDFHLDPRNPPRAERGVLVCYYSLQNLRDVAAALHQSTNGRRCTVRPDHLGFNCVR